MNKQSTKHLGAFDPLSAKQDVLTESQLAAVNSGVTSDVVSQVQTNQQNIAALDAELDVDRPWQKPADWVDIRSGALDSSVYFLVGHSADYSSYRKFAVNATVSNSGTYDVYVDGVKQATTASGTATELDWQTLALTSGADVAYPTSLRTHIVRVTPSSSANTLDSIRCAPVTGQTEQGMLWAHFTTTNSILTSFFAGAETGCKNELLESVTAINDELKIKSGAAYNTSGMQCIFARAASLVNIPTLVGSDASVLCAAYMSFYNTKIKKISLKNVFVGFGAFNTANNLEEIKSNIPLKFQSGTESLNMAGSQPKLKYMPALTIGNSNGIYMKLLSSLTPTVIDLSSGNSYKVVCLSGTSSNLSSGIKGLIVSSAAPFDGGSPQIDVSYTGLDRNALVNLFNSLPTVTDSQVINVTGATGADDLEAADLAIATGKGWTVTR